MYAGATAPVGDDGDSGLAWPVWLIVVVSISGAAGLALLILMVTLWVRYCWCWGDPPQVLPDHTGAWGGQMPGRDLL